MSKTYTVSITVKVVDEAALKQRAENRAVFHEGHTPQEWADIRKTDGDGPEADLTMMLDPGILRGCEILETTVEVVHVD